MEIILTGQQQEASKLIKEWIDHRTHITQIFTLSGYAGTGKTFLIDYLVRNILKLDDDDVAFVAPTGKAASELTKKGLNAMTLHKLIYRVQEEEIDEKNEDGEAVLDDSGKPIKKKKLSFVKKDQLDQEYDLIVIDEVSMVDEFILKDALSYGIPILAVGDKGQLPAIQKSHGLLDKPDYILTEIVRQALDNPIIKIATMIRKGEYIPFGSYGTKVVVADKKRLPKEFIDNLLDSFDQVLCGTNRTRKKLNTRIRKIKGIDTEKNPLPIVQDKIICLANNWELEFGGKYNLVNGMLGYVDNVEYKPSDTVDIMSIDFKPDFYDEKPLKDLLVDPGIFSVDENTRSIKPDNEKFLYNMRQKIYRGIDGRLSLRSFDREPKKKDKESTEEYSTRLINNILNRQAKEELQINRFDFGYAITAHKSQGSEWNNVIVFDESFIMRSEEDKRRWLYTCATRAKEKLIILR